jgi:hypothetical protein
MAVAVLVCLILLVLAAFGIGGTLKRIAEHNERFAPPGVGAQVEPGDLVRFRSFGSDQVCRVVELADGAVVVEPLGAESHDPEPL